MHRYIPVAVIIAFFLGLVLLVWTVMTSVLYDPNEGLTSELDEMAQEDMDGEFLDNWNEHHDRDDDSFGFIGVLIFIVLFLCLVIYAFRRKVVRKE